MDIQEIIDLAVEKAIKRVMQECPRPMSVTQNQAAEMLGISASTVCRMVKQGDVRMNKAGRIPISEVDRLCKVA